MNYSLWVEISMNIHEWRVKKTTPTWNLSSPIHSLTWDSTTSISAMMSSCKGLVFPRTAPNDINTVAAAKSADNILKNSKKRLVITRYSMHTRTKQVNDRAHHGAIMYRSFNVVLMLAFTLLYYWILSTKLGKDIVHNYLVVSGYNIKKHCIFYLKIFFLP